MMPNSSSSGKVHCRDHRGLASADNKEFLTAMPDKKLVSTQRSRTPSPSPSMRLGRIIASPYHQPTRSRSPSPSTPCHQRMASAHSGSTAALTPSPGVCSERSNASAPEKYRLIASDNPFPSSQHFDDEAFSAAVQAAVSQLRTKEEVVGTGNKVSTSSSTIDDRMQENLAEADRLQELQSFASIDAVAYSDVDDYSTAEQDDIEMDQVQDENTQLDFVHVQRGNAINLSDLMGCIRSDISKIMRPQTVDAAFLKIPELKRANRILSDSENHEFSDDELCAPDSSSIPPPITFLYLEQRVNGELEGYVYGTGTVAEQSRLDDEEQTGARKPKARTIVEKALGSAHFLMIFGSFVALCYALMRG